MKPIKLKSWIIAALFLIGMGLIVDYYFIHILFTEKQHLLRQNEPVIAAPESTNSQNVNPNHEAITPANTQAPIQDNFLKTLQGCVPEIASQGVATPNAFLEYLQKSIGVKAEHIEIENYHLKLADGSERRVHVVTLDNTNGKDNKELRFFKLDEEGQPERLPLSQNETLSSLLSRGHVYHQEKQTRWDLKDGSHVSLKLQDQNPFEFQYTGHGKSFSCRAADCKCQ
jgi:hypothetical protein